MTRQKTYGLVVLVLVIALNGGRISKRPAVAAASSMENRQLQQELVGLAEMQRNTPIRCIGSLDLSPIFHALAVHANALGLSADQKTLLKDLEGVTREGYVRIGRRNLEGSTGPDDAGKNRADRISRIRAEFVKHAEQVALLGVLSERQAEKLQVVMRKK